MVNFPNLKLPPHLPPWDSNHLAVSVPDSVVHVFISHVKTSHKYPVHHFFQYMPIPVWRVPYRKHCCYVNYILLDHAWAMTIHTFQGFEAGFNEMDTFNHFVCDLGNVAWEQNCPGVLYTTISRAETVGTDN